MNVNGTTLDIDNMIGRDAMATGIANTYVQYFTAMATHRADKKELRNYIFATDTTTTSNSKLPWKNSTTMPKLCQIRDNLHTNYMAAILPNSQWLKWEGDNVSDVTVEKRNTIEAYMRSKVRQPAFENEISKLLYDYIDEGNAYCLIDFVDESKTDEETGEVLGGYRGPRLLRISPLDIVFNPSATSFKNTPKIIRSIVSLGDLKKQIANNPTEAAEEAFKFAIEARRTIMDLAVGDLDKSDTFTVDGFGTLQEYMSSNMVEILTFYGDFYDVRKDELLEDRVIQVIDRSFVLSNKKTGRWEVGSTIHHVGWRQRPDNLIAMGPLDNLVGMQYRIDHLENQKADMVDFTNTPVTMIRGEVEDFDWAPGAKIYVGDEGDVRIISPDLSVANMDFQIERYEQKMEEMAGAPKQALGFRTPGEKTAFEVQVLDNGANKIFLTKAESFEKHLLAPALNDMLEIGRRNMGQAELVQVVTPLGAMLFKSISREDISGGGSIFPVGASHFAKNANALQTLIGVFNSPIGQNPAVLTHFSGLKLAQLIENLVDLKQFSIVGENISVSEQMETQRLIQQAQIQLDTEAQTPAGIVEGDLQDGAEI